MYLIPTNNSHLKQLMQVAVCKANAYMIEYLLECRKTSGL